MCIPLKGQESGNVPASTKIASPTAASLGKVADVPVSYHTGIPDISIPLYTVEEGPLKFPINLSYHAGGLKVMEQSGWVGAGWNLGSGVITRSVRGRADDRASQIFPNTYTGDKGYYSYTYDATDQLQYLYFGSGQLDSEPDLYFFNVNGITGSFYLRADNTPVLVPQQDIKIVPVFCGTNGVSCVMQQGEITGWKLFTSDGTRYVFGRTEENNDATPGAFEITRTMQVDGPTEGYNYSPLSSWYLASIESADLKHEIKFEYAAEKYSYYTLSLYPTYVGYGGMSIVKNLVEAVRLSKITVTDGTITFVPDPTPRADMSLYSTGVVDLDNIEAKALKEMRIEGTGFSKSFDFGYSYFTDTHPLLGAYGMTSSGVVANCNLHTDAKRLKLDWVAERSTTNPSNPPYKFTYFDEGMVPRTLSLAQDHWGFFNNAVDNQWLVPSFSLDGGLTYGSGTRSNRDAAWPAMRAGTLKSVQYPAGGTTEFTFNHHDVWIQRSTLELMSGGFDQPISVQSGFQSPKYDLTVSSMAAPTTPFKVTTDWLYAGPPSPQQPCHGGRLDIDYIKPDGSVDPSKSYGQDLSFGTNEAIIRLQPGSYKFYMTSGDDRPYCGISSRLQEEYLYTRYENAMVGGLRVEGITSAAPESIPLTQTFVYNNSSGDSQAVLFSRPNYVALTYNARDAEGGVPLDVNFSAPNTLNENGCWIYNRDGSKTQYIYAVSPGSIHPMQTTQGNHVGYNQVVVTQPDGGSTVYKYHPYTTNLTGDVCTRAIDWNVCSNTSPNYPPAPVPYEPHRGELENVSVYNAAGVLLRVTKMQDDYSAEAVGVTGLAVRNMAGNFTYTLVTDYELKNYKKTKSTRLEWLYDANSPTTPPLGTLTESYYANSAYDLVGKTVVTAVHVPVSGTTGINEVVRDKVLQENRNMFVSDISLCATGYTADQDLLNGLAVAQTTYQNDKAAAGTNFHQSYTAWLNYIKAVNTARKDYVTARINYYLGYSDCWNQSTNWNNASTDLKPLIDLRNRNQISGIIETSSWRDNNFLGSSFITYQTFEGNRKYIYPGKLEVIRPSTLSPTFTPVTNTSSALVKDTRYDALSLEETYNYQGGGYVKEVTLKNGVITSYLWDTSTKRLIAKAVGVPFATLQAAYTAQGLTNIRNDAGLARAMVTTYTHSPFVGLTSQTDVTGLKTSYTYDFLGRLTLIKDNNGSIQKKIDYHYKGMAQP